MFVVYKQSKLYKTAKIPLKPLTLLAFFPLHIFMCVAVCCMSVPCVWYVSVPICVAVYTDFHGFAHEGDYFLSADCHSTLITTPRAGGKLAQGHWRLI